MNWDIFVFFANIFLTIGIIPQLYKNFKTKNVESHCIYWHFCTMIGLFMLMFFYVGKLNLIITSMGLSFTIIFRFSIIYQILKYKKSKPKDSLTELWDNPEDERWNSI